MRDDLGDREHGRLAFCLLGALALILTFSMVVISVAHLAYLAFTFIISPALAAAGYEVESRLFCLSEAPVVALQAQFRTATGAPSIPKGECALLSVGVRVPVVRSIGPAVPDFEGDPMCVVEVEGGMYTLAWPGINSNLAPGGISYGAINGALRRESI